MMAAHPGSLPDVFLLNPNALALPTPPSPPPHYSTFSLTHFGILSYAILSYYFTIYVYVSFPQQKWQLFRGRDYVMLVWNVISLSYTHSPSQC